MLERLITPDPATAKSAGTETSPEAPVAEVFHPQGRSPVLLLCDHASNHMPADYGRLGLGADQLARHIAWDIGAAEVTRRMAEALDATAVLSHFSRLLIDPNRRLDDPTLIPEISDRCLVPGNRQVDREERARRIARFHGPYHRLVEDTIEARLRVGKDLAILSIHSFTPLMLGRERPWPIGILWNQDGRLPVPMMALLRAEGVNVGDNEPYSGRNDHGYCIHRHAEARGLPHALIELRQDLIDTRAGAEAWAARLVDTMRRLAPEVGLALAG